MAWVPLESNPEVLTKFIGKLGVSEKWQVVDVYGLDDDMLAILPQPVLAFILIFPITQRYEDLKNSEEDILKEKGQQISDNVYFMKQTVRNACGAVALLHCLANSKEKLALGDGFLKQFLEDTQSLNYLERGTYLENSNPLATIHKEVSSEGQTEAPSENDSTDNHFVAFVYKDNSVYELDGRKSFPINHGSTTEESFVKDAAAVLKKLLDLDPSELRFGICALTAATD